MNQGRTVTPPCLYPKAFPNIAVRVYIELRSSQILMALLSFGFWAMGCGERYYKGELPRTPVIEQNARDSAPAGIVKSSFKEISGKVVKIADGDTFTLIFDNSFEVRVRLNGIDCPEKKQAFSTRAKQALSDLIFGKEVIVKYERKDRYGRVLGNIYVDGIDVNQEMVRQGFAWHFKKYSNDPILAKLEEEAKENKLGLWADPSAIPPWKYRKK